MTMLEQAAFQPLIGRDESLSFSPAAEVSRHLQVENSEAAAAALLHLWQDLDLGIDPLLFLGSRFALHRHHQAYFLQKSVEQRHQPGCDHLLRWKRITPPPYAHGIAEIPIAGPLRKLDYIREASVYDRNTVSAPVAGWYRYDFVAGWSALSVMLPPDHDGDASTVTVIPQGRQDEWLAFLQSLGKLHNELLKKDRAGVIDVVGGDSYLAESVKGVTFDDVILPEDILQQVAAQRRIFSPDLLERYASFRVTRMRKVLLAGPPGTGKTTLLKAEAAHHAQQGGYVLYVFTAKKDNQSWENLSAAMYSAAESRLPTLIIVEDFEQFVSSAEDPQQVLNTLDGIATPDNPAGTLILATTNAPEKIDPRIKDRPGRIDIMIEVGLVEREDLVVRFLQRFLGTAYVEQIHAPVASEFLQQTGSHIREVCLLGMIHSLDKDHETVLAEDLLWAHDTILDGRSVVAQPERFLLPTPRRILGLGFGKNGKKK